MTGSMASEAAAAAAAADGLGDCSSAPAAAAGYGCCSPRISFSTDFAQLDKVSSPNRRTSAAEYSAEFEFCLSAQESLLPADEIFFNGKLLPLHLVPSSCIKELLLLEEGSNAPSAGQSCVSSACPSPFRQAAVPCSQQNDYASSPPRPTPTCTGSWKELLGLGRKPRKQHFKLVRLLFSKERPLSGSVKASASGVNSPVEGSLGEKPASSQTECQGTLHLSPVASGPQESENSTLVDVGPEDPPAAEADSEAGSGSPDGEGNLVAHTSATEITGSPAGGGTSRRGNSGRIMLKNLERCTRNCTAARSSPSKQQQQHVHTVAGASGSGGAAGVGEKQVSGSFSSRVAPVLNVPMCMDPVKEAKTTMTGLRRLLSGKKPGGSLHRVSWTCPGGAL